MDYFHFDRVVLEKYLCACHSRLFIQHGVEEMFLKGFLLAYVLCDRFRQVYCLLTRL